MHDGFNDTIRAIHGPAIGLVHVRKKDKNMSDELKDRLRAAIGTENETQRVMRRLGWVDPESAADHGGRIDAAPDNEPRQRATDASQGRGLETGIENSPAEDFRRQMNQLFNR